jgi:hypothetical protein
LEIAKMAQRIPGGVPYGIVKAKNAAFAKYPYLINDQEFRIWLRKNSNDDRISELRTLTQEARAIRQYVLDNAYSLPREQRHAKVLEYHSQMLKVAAEMDKIYQGFFKPELNKDITKPGVGEFLSGAKFRMSNPTITAYQDPTKSFPDNVRARQYEKWEKRMAPIIATSQRRTSRRYDAYEAMKAAQAAALAARQLKQSSTGAPGWRIGEGEEAPSEEPEEDAEEELPEEPELPGEETEYDPNATFLGYSGAGGYIPHSIVTRSDGIGHLGQSNQDKSMARRERMMNAINKAKMTGTSAFEHSYITNVTTKKKG